MPPLLVCRGQRHGECKLHGLLFIDLRLRHRGACAVAISTPLARAVTCERGRDAVRDDTRELRARQTIEGECGVTWAPARGDCGGANTRRTSAAALLLGPAVRVVLDGAALAGAALLLPASCRAATSCHTPGNAGSAMGAGNMPRTTKME